LCNFFTKGGEIEELNEISQFEKKQFGGKLWSNQFAGNTKQRKMKSY
jgi:hypothetical protein